MIWGFTGYISNLHVIVSSGRTVLNHDREGLMLFHEKHSPAQIISNKQQGNSPQGLLSLFMWICLFVSLVCKCTCTDTSRNIRTRRISLAGLSVFTQKGTEYALGRTPVQEHGPVVTKNGPTIVEKCIIISSS